MTKMYSIAHKFIALLLVALASCNMPSPYFQKQMAIPETQWAYDFQPVFKVEIRDTSTRYRTYFLLRHDDAFPYANLWLQMRVKGPGDSVFNEGVRIEKVLADPEGNWLGRGMAGIWEHKLPLQPKEQPDFHKEGVYEIKLEQIMRTNPLPSVLNAGIMIEKIK